MIDGLAENSVAPILVLGLGNTLLRDDGVGPELVLQLASEYDDDAHIEFLDGGTQGLNLLGYLEGRKALLILDAVSRDERPGTVCVLGLQQVLALCGGRGSTAHEGNAGDLLRTAALLGCLPANVIVVGVEPGSLTTGLGLSKNVRKSLGEALAEARSCLEGFRSAVREPVLS